MQCIFNSELRCLNTYFSRGVEVLSCWGENKDFLEALRWYIDNPLPSIPMDPEFIPSKNKRFDNWRVCKRAEIRDWFTDHLTSENYLTDIEPWIASGALDVDTRIRKEKIYMTHHICAILRYAEVNYFASTLRFRED